MINSIFNRDGLTYALAAGITHHDKCPIVKGVVRGELYVAGWVLK